MDVEFGNACDRQGWQKVEILGEVTEMSVSKAKTAERCE